MLELEHRMHPTLLQAHVASSSLPPALSYFPFFPPFSEDGVVLGAQGADGGVQGEGCHQQRGAVVG